MALICAIADYAKDGTILEVPPEAKTIFALLRKKQDRANAAYDAKCEINKRNGSKGGKAKARNAEKVTEKETAPRFKPPTLTQFKNAVKALSGSDQINPDCFETYDVESLYDLLAETKWRIGDVHIARRGDWEDIIRAKFCYGSSARYRNNFYEMFRYAFSKYDGFRDETGRSLAYSTVCDFSDDHDLNQAMQVIGPIFKQYLSENRPP